MFQNKTVVVGMMMMMGWLLHLMTLYAFSIFNDALMLLF